MKQEQLDALCKRHDAVLLSSSEQILSIAVVENPSPELVDALRFATQKRVDIECWSQEQMDKHLQIAARQANRDTLTKKNGSLPRSCFKSQ